MNVNRTCVINPIEPSPLSFRMAVGMASKLNVNFFGQDGEPYDNDVGGQLQLTGRSTNRTSTYFMYATDIANGRARAVIPAGELTDPNGYRLRLVGTVNSEPTLLALGTVVPTAAAGLETIPEDIVDTVDLTFDYDAPVDLDVTLWDDTGKSDPYDLTDELTSLTATVYDARGGAALVPFSVTVMAANQVKLSLTVDQVNALPPLCWWTMVASTPAGATTLCEGSVTIEGVIEPPLPVTTDSWTYVKPATADAPTTGQIVHANVTQSMLKISALSQPGTDRIALLADLEAGDRITIGATTWTVRFTVYDPGGWYEVYVSPTVQSATTGLTPVLFEPPA